MKRLNTSGVRRFLVCSLNCLFHKNKHKVFFASMPDFSDNSRAVYDYMSRQAEFSDWTFVWLVSKEFKTPQLTRVVFVRQPSSNWTFAYFRYLYHVYTSKYLFCTHSHFVEANPKYQVSVCLWHGTMLKRICAMNEREKGQPKKDQFKFFIAPSAQYVDFFCKSFLCDAGHVLVTGYPRNDFLYQKSAILNLLGINHSSFRKTIVYMPTFRNPVGGNYSDSVGQEQSCITITQAASLHNLNTFLQSLGVLLIIKWHPADTRQNRQINVSNIISLDNSVLSQRGLQTYHLLHYADALITDYSSVFCDYMILDRPIAFDVVDIASYTNCRGFVFENPLDYMPGYILRTSNDLMGFISDVSNEMDKSEDLRHRLMSVYNDFSGENYTRRLVNAIVND